jgi:hypothetical protein
MTDKELIKWLKRQRNWFKKDMEKSGTDEEYGFAEGAYIAYQCVLEKLKEKSDDGKL